MSERHDIWAVADALQMDLRSASAKLVELRSRLAALDLPNPSEAKCPICGVKRTGPRAVAEHVYVSHGGALPAHVIDADRLAQERPE